MKLRGLLTCFMLSALLPGACAPEQPPVAERRQFEAWYADDTVERIVLLADENRAEVHLRFADGEAAVYTLPFDDFGIFVNDYLGGLDRQYPDRHLIITIR